MLDISMKELLTDIKHSVRKNFSYVVRQLWALDSKVIKVFFVLQLIIIFLLTILIFVEANRDVNVQVTDDQINRLCDLK